MKVTKVFAAAAVLLLSARVVSAQVAGIPFYPTATGLGVMVAAEYGSPDPGKATVGLRAGTGFGPFGISAMVAQVKSLSTETAIGGTVAMKVFGGGLVPVSIGVQGGFATWKDHVMVGFTPTTRTVTYMPVGVVARASIPLFPLKPFAVGYYALGTNLGTREKEFRANVGADFNLLLGLGFHAAYDYGSSFKTWGVGAHFNFRLPIPMM